MERADLLDLAFLLWGDETEAEARVAAALRRRGDVVAALLRTRSPSGLAAVRRDPWWVPPELAARGARTAAALAALDLRERAAVVLAVLDLPLPPGLPEPDADRVRAVLGPEPRTALADRLACRHPPARDDADAAADARADARRRLARTAVAGAALLAVGGLVWLAPRAASPPGSADAPTAPPTTAPTLVPASVARLVALAPGDTPVSLAAATAVDAVAAAAGVPVDGLEAQPVWSGAFDTRTAGLVDAVVVQVALPDGTLRTGTAFAQGRENQTFLVASCGTQDAGPVSAARCSTADPGTGARTTTVLVTGLTAPATLVSGDGTPLATLTPDATGATTVRDDAAAGTAVRLSTGTEVEVTAP